MAIVELSQGRRNRAGIVVIGRHGGFDETPFKNRAFQIIPEDLHSSIFPTASTIDASLIAAIDSVIVSQTIEKPTRIAGGIARRAADLLNHDCRVYVRCAGGSLQGKGRAIVVNILEDLKLPTAGLTRDELLRREPTTREREGTPLAPCVYLCDAGLGDEDLAELIARNPAGTAPNQLLSIHVDGAREPSVDLSPEEHLLLRRAFADCKVVHLIQMQDGLSGAQVFRAYAELEEGLGGGWPMLHFVKLGPRKIIADEYANYEGHALNYVPFNLGPRLDLIRCGLGSTRGILVGDFVEQAESIRVVAPQGRGVHVLANLFSVTLRAWHNGAVVDNSRTIADALSPLIPTAIPAHRAAKINELGGTASLQELVAKIASSATTSFLAGTVHADLNATNVLARGSDAVIIDFASLKEGWPVIYDVASVEAALLVDGFAEDKRPIDSWYSSITSLYTSDKLFEIDSSCHPRDASSWFFDCVRQIRQYGRQLERGSDQFAIALAVALLKKSCNPAVLKGRREECRAAAYVFAEKILRNIAP